MKSRTLGIGVSVVATVALLLGADVSGTWHGMVKLPNGQNLPFTAKLKTDGDRLTGALAAIPPGSAPDIQISDGRVDGNTISFSAVRGIQGKTVKFNYTGTLAGDELKIRIVQADGGGNPLEVTTKRAGE